MKVVIAVHQLPAEQPGGVGLFTTRVAQELSLRGHEVVLVAGSETRGEGPALLEQLDDGPMGVRTLVLRRGKAPRTGTFLESFINPAADKLLGALLEQEKPDVLHIQHTIHLSSRLATLGRAAGAAVVASVHDYWPICQRTDLRPPDGSLCDGPGMGVRCARCLPPPPRPGFLTNLMGRPFLTLGQQREAALRLGPYLLRTQLVQGCYDRAHRLTVPSPFLGKLLQRHGFDGKRIVVVDYGVPPLPPGVAGERRPHQPLTFGYLGTLGGHKGVRVLLRALEHLPLEPGWRLRIHGGPLRDKLLRRDLEAAEKRGDAEYRGPYTAEHLPGILAELDAVVIPSLWQETGPMVWMEAAAAGLPVVASRMGGLRQRVKDNEDGLLVGPGDPRALARAMGRLMADYPRFREAALRREVRTVEQATDGLLAVYEEARVEATR